MENIYLIIVGVLFFLAITDLIVGVSNDAVNFLVAAIGSKAGKFKVIMIMASLGVLFGAILSDGMMEIARKGIFHPDMLSFERIIIIFLAVMLTDIILLDFFNTFGFPTSTTVSLVFELLGAAVAISLMVVLEKNEGNVAEYINTSKALAIIGGILLSVVVAFTIGAIIQWFARIIFSFNYKKPYKYFGAVWGGIAITAITFFMFIKGFKHSNFSDLPAIQWILSHKLAVIGISFVSWTIIFQLLISLFKVNILKIIVLIGTFALAMAFAGNDLVNFIGVPIAGYTAYDMHEAGRPMSEMAGQVEVNPIFLVIAGIIMIGTLWTSKKARSVTDTSVNLSRQNAGYERFGSTLVSRALVRWAINLGKIFNKIIPDKLQNSIEKRFKYDKNNISDNAPAFDLIRASVTLVVASILIAIATSLKLPLSTTYVTFMVTMGTTLSDRAWGRESAVYRVTGVISVISGWFFTAFVAFSVAFLVAIAIFFGGTFVIGLFVALDIFLIYRSRIIHKKRTEKEQEEIKKLKEEQEISESDILEKSTHKVLNQLSEIKDIIDPLHKEFFNQKRKKLKKVYKKGISAKKSTKNLKHNIYNIVQKLKSEDYLRSAQFYVQTVDALKETSNAIYSLTEKMFDHINNNHEIFNKKQIKNIEVLKQSLLKYINDCIETIKEKEFDRISKLKQNRNDILRSIETVKRQELELIQNEETDVVNSDLYLDILAEYKNLSLYTIRIAKAHKKFYLSGKKTIKIKEEKKDK